MLYLHSGERPCINVCAATGWFPNISVSQYLNDGQIRLFLHDIPQLNISKQLIRKRIVGTVTLSHSMANAHYMAVKTQCHIMLPIQQLNFSPCIGTEVRTAYLRPLRFYIVSVFALWCNRPKFSMCSRLAAAHPPLMTGWTSNKPAAASCRDVATFRRCLVATRPGM